MAFDVTDYQKYVDILPKYGFEWKGEVDVWHFTYAGEGATALNHLNVLSFQKFWNKNNLEDKIQENGIYTEETEKRMLMTPIDGYQKRKDDQEL